MAIGGVFTLKARDTRPILEVALLNPNGTAHDLTGTTAWKLHVHVSPTLIVTRDMVKQGLDTAGILRYSWVAADWVNALPVPTSDQQLDLLMEYEVITGTARMTFPNGGFDTLRIRGDLGQG
jgi:hypothetical protein